MLTKSQIQRIAQRNGVGMQVQERDYLQHLILWLLYRQSQTLIFKGGTALRLVYGGNRYSEDLDFNESDDTLELTALWQDVVGGSVRHLAPAEPGGEARPGVDRTQADALRPGLGTRSTGGGN